MWQTAYDFEIEHLQRQCTARNTKLVSVSPDFTGGISAICSDNKQAYVR